MSNVPAALYLSQIKRISLICSYVQRTTDCIISYFGVHNYVNRSYLLGASARMCKENLQFDRKRSREIEGRIRWYSNTKASKYSSCYLFLSLSGQVVYFHETDRSSHRRCSVKKVFLEISQNSQENTCARNSSLIKWHAWNFINKVSLAQVLPVNYAKFLRTNFLQNASGRLLLKRFLYYYFELLFSAICYQLYYLQQTFHNSPKTPVSEFFF